MGGREMLVPLFYVYFCCVYVYAYLILTQKVTYEVFLNIFSF